MAATPQILIGCFLLHAISFASVGALKVGATSCEGDMVEEGKLCTEQDNLTLCESSFAVQQGQGFQCGLLDTNCVAKALCEYVAPTTGTENSPGESCVDIFEKGVKENGAYFIKPSGAPTAFQVYCNLENEDDGGGWTLVFGNTGNDYRSWRVGDASPLLDPTTADGPSDSLKYTLAKAKFIKWTDTSFKAMLLAEFETVGDYYGEMFGGMGDRNQKTRARYPKGEYEKYDWHDELAQHHANGHFWGYYNGGHKCWWDTNARDRPFYNHGGGRDLAHYCQAYDPPYPWTSNSELKRGGKGDYLIWIKEK